MILPSGDKPKHRSHRNLKYALIVSHADDIHAVAVYQRLQELYAPRVVPVIFDTLTHPVATTIAWKLSSEEDAATIAISDPLAEGVFRDAAEHLAKTPIRHAAISPRQVCSVWWRRPRLGAIHRDVTEAEFREFCSLNSRSLLRAFLHCCPVVNEPDRENLANCKAYQLAIARRVGLLCPDTLITSRPDEARHFVEAQWTRGRQVIYKPLVTRGEYFAPTRLMDRADLARLAIQLPFAPAIFQQRIPGRDLRVAVVGSGVFAAEWIGSLPDATDVRLNAESRMEPYAIAPQLAEALQKLHRRLGLVFGICDLKLTPDGSVFFLETNPSGQWLSLELEARLPISEAWARVLVEGTAAGRTPPIGRAYELQELAQQMPVPFDQTIPSALLDRSSTTGA